MTSHAAHRMRETTPTPCADPPPEPAPASPHSAAARVPERAWLVVWGRDSRELPSALDAAGRFAAGHGCTVVAVIASFGGAMADGVLVADAMRRYARRDIHAGARGWWLVPEQALDPATALLGHTLTRHYRNTAGIEDTVRA